jgi:glycosyltransferase involved in cell wall biosynthesis
MNNKDTRQIVMLGTRFDTMGGISSVVNVYRDGGLFERCPVTYLATHCDGSAMQKLSIFITAFFRFAALLLTGRMGLVHVHMSSRASFWRKSCFLLPAYLFRIPAILHLHGSEFAVFYEQECGSAAQRFVRFVFNSASRVVVLSENWKRWVQGISHNPFVIPIYNPVMTLRQMQPWENRKPGVVLFLGRLGKRKGVYDLLTAACRVAAHCPELKLRLGGDGELEQVTDCARELGLAERVDLLGWVRGDDKERQLDEAWLYALPSYHEGLPMSILEAMAAGLPVLSTPIAGIPEAVTDGVEGFLVPPGDTDMLADRLERLLTEPGLACRMGEAARRKVDTTFSSVTILPRIEHLYSELGMKTI